MKLINQFWAFFASVQLAIVTLCTIAVTSIIGTVIPQGQPAAFYVDKFGAKTALFFQILDITTMYSSWWFYGLLGILSLNLIVCSFDRIPAVWRIITFDNLAISPDRIKGNKFLQRWEAPSDIDTAINCQTVLQKHGWPCQNTSLGNHSVAFSQKGRWSRMGVYIVHLSILIIFIGSIIGYFYGFKGSIMIPETRGSDKIFPSSGSQPIDLGFTVRCNSFVVDFYDNGMPKEFRSNLTILENNKEILQQDIRVNSPLTYRGITFYQSSYQGHQEFLLHVTDEANGESRHFSLPFQQQVSWNEKNLRFGVINAEAVGQRAVRAKVWFKAGEDQAITEWLADNTGMSISSGGQNYSLKVKQLYSTGLQVSKDPGVWTVYAGCGLLMLGLIMAFFWSHRRIWLYKEMTASGCVLYLAGSANKNKAGFTKEFTRLATLIDETLKNNKTTNT